MAVELSAGKLRNLMCLSSEDGQFFMLAIDQRGSLQKSLQTTTGKDPSFDDMAECKQIITDRLAHLGTAVLTDPIYGLARSMTLIPREVGILVAYEHSGASKHGPSGRELRTSLVEGWSVQLISRAGANAVKLLIQYNPDASAETLDHQQSVVRKVGQECAQESMPFLLELTGYPLDSDDADTPEYARQKPEIVARSAAEFSKPEYLVDILKLEFPANLKYTNEYAANAVLDGKQRQPVYSVRDVAGFCRAVNDASSLPWVILSAAVNIEEFLINVEMACAAGASGFLCGRAIWKDAIKYFPQGEEPMGEFLDDTGRFNFNRAIAAASMALPWWNHRKFGGSVQVTGADNERWHEQFSKGAGQVQY
ncbi:MAG: tagatose 1,6-diphosphate aldolase [Chloroflexi bacterium]|nr:tagatose 1,6-diphosphate aldolase [Chloroflexota bacterium]